MQLIFRAAAVAALLLPTAVRAQTPTIQAIDGYQPIHEETQVAGGLAPSVPEGGILNNASYMLDNLPADGVARGSMFAVFGSRLSSGEVLSATTLPLGTDLGGTQIEVTVNGVTRQAFPLVTSPGQLAAIMPSNVPPGVGTLTVSVGGVRSQPTRVKVVNSAFGAFARNQAGYGPSIVQNYVSATEQPVNAITDAAHPGQAAILWGTGLGPIMGDDAGPPPVGTLPVTVEVWVGDRPAGVLYAGRSPQFPGIDQINFTVPEGVVGCYVPVVVVVNGVASNHVTMAITNQGAYCSDFQTFLPGELEAVASHGEGGFGFIEMTRFRGTLTAPTGVFPVAVDQFLGEFIRHDVTDIVAMTPRREAMAPIGSCIVTLERAGEGGGRDRHRGMPLGAGAELRLQGPRGAKSISQDGSSYETTVGGGFGSEMLPEYFEPGEYTLQGGSASAEVGSFETKLTMSDGLQWLNPVTTLRRDQDWTARWSGGDPETEFVVIAIQSLNRADGVYGAIFCSAAADAGSFTVPRRHLGALPASTVWPGDGDPTGLVSVGVESRSSLGRIEAEGLVGGRFYYALREVHGATIE